jgi:tetratricopeptide (TPR) repeat protein
LKTIPLLTILAVLVTGTMGLSGVQAQAPNPAQSNRATAATYAKQGDNKYAAADYKGAVEAYTQALEIFNQSDYAYYNRGNAYRKLKDYKAAIADYTQAIQLNPQNTFAYLYRGAAYQGDGQSELAIADYTALIKMDDQNAGAYAKRGEAYLSLKQKEAGIADLTKAADIYKKLKEPEKSERILSQLRSLK